MLIVGLKGISGLPFDRKIISIVINDPNLSIILERIRNNIFI